MPTEERDGLVAGPSSSGQANEAIKDHKIDKFRGLICWGIFGAFLIFFIIMAAVYTNPKGYTDAVASDYLTDEEVVLYNGLGSISTPATSTRVLSAQAYFLLGLQLLHVFWYDLAIDKFQKARYLDPNFALAYWGEAMCYKQPLWQTENVTAAQEVLARLAKSGALAKAPARDQQYVAAVQLLFSNASLQSRETDYANAMQALYDDQPNDANACTFAALAVLGTMRSVGNYLSAAEQKFNQNWVNEILHDCVTKFPGHAGAWNYLTNFYDVNDIAMAAQGKAPSLTLAAVAPKSNVAQHMVSHIFVRFGNWSEVVVSNQRALAASDEYCKAVNQGYACDADNRWHALEWQLYGQTQQCAAKAAYASLARMQTVAAAMNYSGDYVQWLYRSYAHVQLQSLNYFGAVGLKSATDNATDMLPAPLVYNDPAAVLNAADISDHFWPPHAEAHALLARVHALTYNANATQLVAVNATVIKALNRLNDIVTVQQNLVSNASAMAAAPSLNTDMLTLLIIVNKQAQALYWAAPCANKQPSCNATAWRSLMTDALQLYNNISRSTALPSLKIAPAPEFFGNLVLRTGGNASESLEYYQQCLKDMPGRMQCVLGVARSQTGDAKISQYQKLLTQCSAGDKDFPALVEAQKGAPAPPAPPAKKGLLRRTLRAEGVAGLAMAA